MNVCFESAVARQHKVSRKGPDILTHPQRYNLDHTVNTLCYDSAVLYSTCKLVQKASKKLLYLGCMLQVNQSKKKWKWAKFLNVMWTKLVSSWVTSTYRRKVNYRCLVRAGICAQATIQSSLFHKSCFTSKLHVSNSIYYQTIWSNVRAYATRNKKYVPNSNSFLRRIPREAWILLLLGEKWKK